MDGNTEVVTMETANKEKEISLVRYQDVIMPKPMMPDPVSRMKEIYALEHREGDVMMCTMPKAGTHWIGHMTLKLMGKSIDKDKIPLNALEFNSVAEISADKSPRLIMTHLWPSRIPQDHVTKKGKTILLLRNPKDTMVSFYYHIKNAMVLLNKQTWNEYYDSAVQGNIPFGSHIDLIRAWTEELNGNGRGIQPEVFYYEDFKTNCFDTLKRLDQYLGYSHTDNELRNIVDEHSIDKLRNQSRTSKQHPSLLDKDGHTVIYRKGVVGDWKNHFTVAQNEQYDAMIKKALDGKIKQFKY